MYNRFSSCPHPPSSLCDSLSRITRLYTLYDVAATPYATWGFGSPGAIKLVSQFFCALAAEHLAMVGELDIRVSNLYDRKLPKVSKTYFLEIESVK